MKNLLFPLGAVLIWSINSVVSKLAAGAIDPGAISFYRWALALILLTPFLLLPVWRQRAVIKQHVWKLFILGLLGMGFYQSLAYYAAYTVSATFMGIINSLIPLLTVILSIPVLRIAPTIGIALGTILSLSGLTWLVSKGNPAELLTHGLGRGELLMFVAGLAYALYGVLAKRWSVPLPGIHSIYMQIVFGVILLIPVFLSADNVALTADNIGLVLYAGIAASIFAPLLWILGVTRLGANAASIFMNLAPILTAIIAAVFLKEELHSYHIIGGGVVLIGVILAQRLRTPLTQVLRRKTKKTTSVNTPL
ncbi:DMT family transporter [Morganella psychrotolerans]|uniref:DMT family transporter n=1 Tax=Morganella psychrotolerans TaxID=368603 RepID=UPI0039B05B4F